MTIRKKAEKEGLPVEKVAELASAAGIDAEDVDRELEKVEAMMLGKAVNGLGAAGDSGEPEDLKPVRFWTEATRHLVQAGDDRLEFKGHVLVLEPDDRLVAVIRSLKNIVGRYGIHEVLDEPFEEESDEAVRFSQLLESLVFTGHSHEMSRAGIKAVRAMFSPDELVEMGENGFDPRRLVMRAVRTKSIKNVCNQK